MSGAGRRARTVSSMRVATIFPAYLAGLALLVGACGGASDGVGSGAEVAPSSTAVFISIRTDFDGDGWEVARGHAAKFPAVGDALEELARELGDEGLDFERDVRPALGPELAIAVVDPDAPGDDGLVALTQPPDEEKLDALVAESDDLVYEMVDDWAVIAKSADAIEAFAKAAEDATLDESDGWEQATDGLPDDALVTGYVNGAALTEGIGLDESGSGGFGGVLDAVVPGGRFPSVGFAASAEDDGIRFQAASTMDGEELEEYEASLPDELPAGALAVVSWNDAAGYLRGALRRAGDADPEFDRYVAQAELALGLSLEREIFPLLEGEGALAVYPFEAPEEGETDVGWSGNPNVALVLEVEDEEQALTTLDRVVERASELLGSIEETGDVDVDGITAHSVSLEGFDLLYAAFDGKLVVATNRDAIAGFVADGERLADATAFEEARSAADAPEETAGFAFVDIEAVADAFLAEAPPEIAENLDPLSAVFVYGTADDGEVAVDAFLGIE